MRIHKKNSKISRKIGYFTRKDVYNKKTGSYEERNYKVIRDEKGRFKALFAVSGKYIGKYIREKEHPKTQKKFIKQKYKFDKKLKDYKIRTMRSFSKKRLIEENRMTNITERVYSQPHYNKRGKLEVYFIFYRLNPYKKAIKGAQSDLSMLNKRTFRYHFNECYKRCLAQIDFSPDNVKIKSIRYIYWFNRKTDKLYQRRRRIYG